MPPELKGLQHVGLKVRDIETAVHFYTDILGFRTNERIRYATPRGQRTAQNFMTCTGLHHVINLAMNVPEAQPDPQPPVVDSRSSVEYGLAHFAFEVEDKATFDAWEKHLRENGVELTHGPVVHSPTHPDGDGLWGENRALYFCDPDGNNIEIFCDMAIVGEDGVFDCEQHTARIRSDGYDPEKVALPELQRDEG
ncbi:MAG: VOC family protein [Nitrospinota bacterium]